MEIKESYQHVIADHEPGCNFEAKKQKYDKCVSLNRKSIGLFGAMLFWQIVEQNMKNQQIIGSASKAVDKFKLTLNKNHEKSMDKLTQNNKKLTIVYLVSLLGWKQHRENLNCEYCNETVQNFRQFNLTESHRSCCLLVTDSHW